jgi:hypothetical protein
MKAELIERLRRHRAVAARRRERDAEHRIVEREQQSRRPEPKRVAHAGRNRGRRRGVAGRYSQGACSRRGGGRDGVMS